MITVDTGFKGKPRYVDCLRGVLGQMSDGIWENTPSMGKYWRYADISDDGIIHAEDFEGSGWKDMSESDIKRFFGEKVKRIAMICMEDEGAQGVWSEGCKKTCRYLGCTYGDAYVVSHILSGAKYTPPEYNVYPDSRNLICPICGKSYHVDNYDPGSPSADMCLECYREALKEAK